MTDLDQDAHGKAYDPRLMRRLWGVTRSHRRLVLLSMLLFPAIAALELHWSGARVTLIHRGEQLHRHVKYWIKPNLENRIAAGEIKACFRSRIVAIEPRRIRVATPDGEQWFANDFVFAMIGYHPDLEFLAAHRVNNLLKIMSVDFQRVPAE